MLHRQLLIHASEAGSLNCNCSCCTSVLPKLCSAESRGIGNYTQHFCLEILLPWKRHFNIIRCSLRNIKEGLSGKKARLSVCLWYQLLQCFGVILTFCMEYVYKIHRDRITSVKISSVTTIHYFFMFCWPCISVYLS